MSALDSPIGELKRALAASKQVPGEKDGHPRVDENGQQIYELRAFLFFENQRPVQGKVSSLTRITQELSEGDDIELQGLTLRFYSGNNGGTGVSFWAEKITPVNASPSKPSPSSSAA